MYLNNRINQNGKFTVGLGQQVARKTYIHATYAIVPYYYLRDYRDGDWTAIEGNVPESFQPFEYAKDEFSIRALQYFRKGNSVSSEFDFSRYFYNEHYTEYDSKRYSGSLRGAHTVCKVIVLNAGYGFALNDAKGYDGDIPGETKQTSDDADDSFREHRGVAGLQWFLPAFFTIDHTLSINGSLRYRKYSTLKNPEIDPIHSGRLEYTLDASAAYTFSIFKPLAVQVEYGRTQRWAGSSHAINNEHIKDEKNYSKNIAALTLRYTFGK
jgi:hypothetical protein